MIKITEKIFIDTTKKADKFFEKHKEIKEKFKENIKDYYHFGHKNVDIKTMKTYKGLYRMRISDFRIIYTLNKNGEIKIIEVLAVDNRGQVYNKF